MLQFDVNKHIFDVIIYTDAQIQITRQIDGIISIYISGDDLYFEIYKQLKSDSKKLENVQLSGSSHTYIHKFSNQQIASELLLMLSHIIEKYFSDPNLFIDDIAVHQTINMIDFVSLK